MFVCVCVGGGTCIPRGHSTRIRRHSNEQRVPDPASGSGDNVAEEEDLFGAVGGEGVKEESGYVGSADVAKAMALVQAERQAAAAAVDGDIFEVTFGHGQKEKKGGCTIL